MEVTACNHSPLFLSKIPQEPLCSYPEYRLSITTSQESLQWFQITYEQSLSIKIILACL